MDTNILKNIIRIGIVSSVNPNKGTVQVIFQDKDEMISNDLPLLNKEYNMPQISESVICIFLPNDIQQGFCFGSFYSETNLPPVNDKNIYCKDFEDGTSIQYDKTSKELLITTVGDLKIKSKKNILIEANGSITTTAGKTNLAISNSKTNPVTHHP